MPSEPDTQLLQKILDEQHFIVAGFDCEVDIGHVFENAIVPSCDGREVWVTMRSVVIGEATVQEFREQQQRYRPHIRPRPPWRYHYKIVAE